MLSVSVIVPVYNAGCRVAACLQSLRAQTLRDFEVICINDGSTDESAHIIREFCAEDARFTLVNQPVNAGVSAARNEGIKRAQARYVMFVDADDTLPENALYCLHQIATQSHADTICGIYERVDGLTTYVNARSECLATKAQRIEPGDLDLIHSWTLCNKWLSNEVIQKYSVRFEGFTHLEDAVFLYSYLRYAKTIATCPHVVYTYHKPLAFLGRTTTQQADKSLVASANQAFMRICELTKDYGDDFLYELRYRYVNSPLLGDYYRRIWTLSDEVAHDVVHEITAQVSMLDAKRTEKLLQNNFDVMNWNSAAHTVAVCADESGVRQTAGAPALLDKAISVYGKGALLTHPLITVIVGPGVSREVVPLLLDELYDQPCVSFCVRVSLAFKTLVQPWYANMPNLEFVDIEQTDMEYAMAVIAKAAKGNQVENASVEVGTNGTESLISLAADSKEMDTKNSSHQACELNFWSDIASQYIAVINDDVIYDYRSLLTLMRTLHEDSSLDYVSLPPKMLVRTSTQYRLFMRGYRKAKRSLVSCCLFRVASLRAKKSGGLKGRQVGKPAMIVMVEPVETLRENLFSLQMVGFGLSAVDVLQGKEQPLLSKVLRKIFRIST